MNKEEKEKLLKLRSELVKDLEDIERVSSQMMSLYIVDEGSTNFRALENSKDYRILLMGYINDKIQEIDEKLGI